MFSAKRVLTIGICTMLAVAAGPSGADVSPDQRPEVDHLLSFIRYSDCEMIRNGSTHNSQEGYRHVLDKYDYFRDRIHSTEDFIDLAASKSMLSGKRYRIKCPNQQPQYSDVWLRHELTRYRACVARGAQDCGRSSAHSHGRR